MLEIASNQARNLSDSRLDKKKLKESLPDIRKMTLQDPETFYPILKDSLLECGVILVALPNLKNAYLNGATKKFKNGRLCY